MPWADLTDVRCHYSILGRGDPLLLIPGLGTTSDIWEPVTGELAEHFTLILVDNRGVGRSKARRDASTLRDLTADLVELMDFLNLDRSHVLGLSLGGVIAQRLAADHPKRIDRLVLVSCTDRFTPYLRQISRLLAHTLRARPADSFARTIEILGCAPEFVDANYEQIEERVRAKCEAGISARAVGRQLRCLSCADVDLARDPISAPTLVVSGEHDVLIPPCYARATAGRIPGSRFALVPGAGHNPLTECPERVLPTIIEFLEHDRRPARPKARPSATFAHRFAPSTALGGPCP